MAATPFPDDANNTLATRKHAAAKKKMADFTLNP